MAITKIQRTAFHQIIKMYIGSVWIYQFLRFFAPFPLKGVFYNKYFGTSFEVISFSLN